MQVYLNGEFMDRDKATVSVDDRGFLFGDGIYEVIRVVKGRPFRMEAHLERLKRGSHALDLPLTDRERRKLPDIMDQLLKKNDLKEGEAAIYLQITRGAHHPRSHAGPPLRGDPTVFVSVSPFQPNSELHEKGVRVITVPDVRWSRCDLKTINLLPNTMAARQARENDVFGVIMIRDGCITEGFNNNVFAVSDGKLITHPDSPYILSGITRDVVFEIAEQAGIPLILRPLRKEEIKHVDEVILTGTTTDIQPVVNIDGRTVAGGQPGPVVRLLQRELYKLMGRFG